jgi:hypothetical protein
MASTNGNAAAAAPSNGSDGGDPRLARLRAAMSRADGGKGVTAYIIPTEDPHMSEYPPDTFKRREYISKWVQVWVWVVGGGADGVARRHPTRGHGGGGGGGCTNVGSSSIRPA